MLKDYIDLRRSSQLPHMNSSLSLNYIDSTYHSWFLSVTSLVLKSPPHVCPIPSFLSAEHAAPISLTMSSHTQSRSSTLQTCAAIFGIVAIFVTLTGIRYRNSLASLLLRRFHRSRTQQELM